MFGRTLDLIPDLASHALSEGHALLACDTDPDLRSRIREAMGEQGVPADKARDILGRVAAAGGLERARQQALALVDSALDELSIVPASLYREALAEVARLSVDRVA